jgi:hypothetical protein
VLSSHDKSILLITRNYSGSQESGVRRKAPAKSFDDMAVWQKAQQFMLASYWHPILDSAC